MAIRRYHICACSLVLLLFEIALRFADGDITRLSSWGVGWGSSSRPGVRGAPLPARAILSMGGLSHSVIRVNTEDKNSALTVQDVGHIMPGGQPLRQLQIAVAPRLSFPESRLLNCSFDCVLALMCIVKPEGPPQLCKTDEIGEIVINSRAGGTLYYGLPGVTKNTFEVCQHLKVISFSSSVLHCGITSPNGSGSSRYFNVYVL